MAKDKKKLEVTVRRTVVQDTVVVLDAEDELDVDMQIQKLDFNTAEWQFVTVDMVLWKHHEVTCIDLPVTTVP